MKTGRILIIAPNRYIARIHAQRAGLSPSQWEHVNDYQQLRGLRDAKAWVTRAWQELSPRRETGRMLEMLSHINAEITWLE